MSNPKGVSSLGDLIDQLQAWALRWSLLEDEWDLASPFTPENRLMPKDIIEVGGLALAIREALAGDQSEHAVEWRMMAATLEERAEEAMDAAAKWSMDQVSSKALIAAVQNAQREAQVLVDSYVAVNGPPKWPGRVH